MNSTINLVVSVDDHYVEHLEDLLISIWDYNSSYFHIYLIHDDSLSNSSIQKLKNLCVESHRGELEDFVFDIDYDKLPMTINYISPVTYFRLFTPYLLKNVDRYLYLDSDMICNGNIEDLYSIDMGDYIIGACRNCVLDPFWFRNAIEVLNLHDAADYVNAGVLVVDAKKYRDFISEDTIYQYLKDHYDILLFQDQDVINALFDQKIYFLDPIYNFQVNCVVGWSSLDQARLIHYSEKYKPWNLDFHYFIRGIHYYYFLYHHGKKIQLRQLLQLQYYSFASTYYQMIEKLEPNFMIDDILKK